VSPKGKAQVPLFKFTFETNDTIETFFIRASTNPELLDAAILMIEGLKYQDKPMTSFNHAGLLTDSTKQILHQKLYFDNFKGGEVKSNEEIWQYSPEGNISLVGSHIAYSWTGAVFQPASGAKVNTGTGVFDGVNLYWFPPSSVKAESKENRNNNGRFYIRPVLQFAYQEPNGTYLDVTRPNNKWVWTRHFLAQQEGKEPEWLVEGDVPRHVVMFMQMLRVFIKKHPETAIPEQDAQTPPKMSRFFVAGSPVSMDSAQVRNSVINSKSKRASNQVIY